MKIRFSSTACQVIFFILAFTSLLNAQYILIPMDLKQTDHLKAYGIAYWILEQNTNVEWLLNFRGGSFLFPQIETFENECRLRGVYYEILTPIEVNTVYATVEENNMEKVLLEKAPIIAVYTPPNSQPWDDAVTLALNYSEIRYDKVYDTQVLAGNLSKYDWLHLHHEDFTGQYGKFWASFKNEPWYIEQQMQSEELANNLGYKKVSELKGAVAQEIKRFIESGGFLFAMCSATDALDIALSAENVDICDVPFDHDPPDPHYAEKLDYEKTLVFTQFNLLQLVYAESCYRYADLQRGGEHWPHDRGVGR